MTPFAVVALACGLAVSACRSDRTEPLAEPFPLGTALELMLVG